MKTIWMIFAVMMIMFGGCSQKEMSDGAKGIGNDISNFGEKVFKVRE